MSAGLARYADGIPGGLDVAGHFKFQCIIVTEMQYLQISEFPLYPMRKNGGGEHETDSIVSDRGQLTLPANVRKRFGIKNGGAIIVEERGMNWF